jgi:hypothetical protein
MPSRKQTKVDCEVARLRRAAASTASDALYRRDLHASERPGLIRAETKQRMRVRKAAPPAPCGRRTQITVANPGPTLAPAAQCGSDYTTLPRNSDLNVGGHRVLATAEVPDAVVSPTDQAFLLNFMASTAALLPKQVRPLPSALFLVLRDTFSVSLSP